MLLFNWKVPKTPKKIKQNTNSGILLHTVFILSSSSRRGKCCDTVTALALLPSCLQERSKTQCPMQRIVKCVLRVPSEAISGKITSTTIPLESLQVQDALIRERLHGCVRACKRVLGVGHEIYICYRAPHWVREVLVDLLNLSIIQHNVDLIMHSEA